jgi:S1-C subfamily serine protease
MRSLLFAGMTALCIAGCSASAGPSKTELAGASVKVMLNGGHGSGTHIGKRYILTAAHVVDSAKEVQIKADDGSLRAAKVLWANRAYDIALLRIDETGTGRVPLKTVPLGCVDPALGDYVALSGNPGNIEFVTTYGRVAGKARKVAEIESVMVLDATVAPGMSGGGVVDASGKVVGVTVALMLIPTGFSASLVPVSYVVPASVVCELMGRV